MLERKFEIHVHIAAWLEFVDMDTDENSTNKEDICESLTS